MGLLFWGRITCVLHVLTFLMRVAKLSRRHKCESNDPRCNAQWHEQHTAGPRRGGGEGCERLLLSANHMCPEVLLTSLTSSVGGHTIQRGREMKQFRSHSCNRPYRSTCKFEMCVEKSHARIHHGVCCSCKGTSGPAHACVSLSAALVITRGCCRPHRMADTCCNGTRKEQQQDNAACDGCLNTESYTNFLAKSATDHRERGFGHTNTHTQMV